VIAVAGDSIWQRKHFRFGESDATSLLATVRVPSRVPDGAVWLQGDNLSNSMDSRGYGAVPIGLIRGKVVARLYPFAEAGKVKSTLRFEGNTRVDGAGYANRDDGEQNRLRSKDCSEQEEPKSLFEQLRMRSPVSQNAAAELHEPAPLAGLREGQKKTPEDTWRDDPLQQQDQQEKKRHPLSVPPER
jgi:hypothetical protein